MTVDFIYLFRQIEFTHQCGHAVVLSPLRRVTGCPEELKNLKKRKRKGRSKPVLEHLHLFCGSGSLWGWGCGVEALNKFFLLNQSSQTILLDKTYVPISFSHSRHINENKWFFSPLYSSEKSAIAEICFPTYNTWIELIILPPLFQ